MTNNIINTFPLPILKISVPEKFTSITSFLNKEKMVVDSTDEVSGYLSYNTYLLDQPIYKSFKDFILSKLNYFGYEVLGINEKKYNLTQSWISIKDPNKHHPIHCHSNSIISGVFFYGSKDKNTPGLNFYSPYHLQPKNSFYITLPFRKDQGFYAKEKLTIPFEPGVMILFPSFLIHGVEQSKSNLSRKSLAFNAIPKKGLGQLKSLNYLKI